MGMALVALLAGTTAVALGVGSSSSPPKHHGHTATRHVAAHKVKVTAAPVLIPPAPTTTTPVPSFSSMVASGVGYDGGGAVPHYSGAVAPPTINGSPTNITDPSVVATGIVPTIPMYAAPGAAKPTRTMPLRNNLGAILTLFVTGFQPGWIQAYIPVRPNESTAWIPASDVSISLVTTHIVVSLSARTLTLYRNNVAVFHTPVAPGEPSSPTPTGSYFVAYIVKLTDPGGPYGPYALGTSDFSNTYFSFEGGPGQVGIHGTDQPWVIGTYASHGCVRLPNAAITTLAQQIVPGTPVEIEP